MANILYRAIPYALAVVWGFILSIWVVFGPLGNVITVK